MQIIEPYAKMLPASGTFDALTERSITEFTPAMGLALLRHVEWCSRISHRSEEAQTQDSWKRIIQNVVIEHGDWSVTEHASVTVDAYVDRGITHEWVRHRMGAYTQESTRFVNYQKKMAPSFVSPFVDAANTRIDAAENWQVLIEHCEMCYQDLISKGCAPQIARSVFPNALASRLIVTYNLRSWRHFFIMRTTKEAHPQMRQVTIPLLAEFKEKIPLLYDDIEPNAKQSESMKKAR
jgi:thymidylate synthase (FAD)